VPPLAAATATTPGPGDVLYRAPVGMSAGEDVNRRLLRARDAMDRRYAEPIDVSDVAVVAHMSRAHFTREFKRVFGETPRDYLYRRRVERAMLLLRTTELSVARICMDVGFASHGTFTRRFAVVVGCSPTAFRAARAADPLPASGGFTMRWGRPYGSSTSGEATSPGDA
jgi:AraC-like DNA-binding protein